MDKNSDTLTLNYYQAMELAVSQLMIEKGYFSNEDMEKEMEFMAQRTPEIGARVVVEAWTNPQFKKQLLEDGTAACESLGIEMGPTRLMVVESTDKVHNVIVCSLCSCFPRMLMGPPPDWYKSRSYRSRVVQEPRNVLSEFGTEVPSNVEVRVHDNTADMRYLVLPRRPPGTEGWTVEALAELVTRNSMIGVGVPKSP